MKKTNCIIIVKTALSCPDWFKMTWHWVWGTFPLLHSVTEVMKLVVVVRLQSCGCELFPLQGRGPSPAWIRTKASDSSAQHLDVAQARHDSVFSFLFFPYFLTKLTPKAAGGEYTSSQWCYLSGNNLYVHVEVLTHFQITSHVQTVFHTPAGSFIYSIWRFAKSSL